MLASTLYMHMHMYMHYTYAIYMQYAYIEWIIHTCVPCVCVMYQNVICPSARRSSGCATHFVHGGTCCNSR